MLIRQNISTKNRTASKLAAELCDEWRRINKALAPIIGPRGITAVFNRALYLAGLHYPFLTVVKDDLLTSNFTSLEITLSRKETELALAANVYLAQCFEELISSLIGESLTSRLLASIPVSSTNHGFSIREHCVQPVSQQKGKTHHAGK